MKKILISSLILASFLTPTVGAVQAQTVDSSAQIEELKSTLTSLLMEMIAQLQAQIDQIIATQNLMISGSVSSPSSGSSASAPASVGASETPSISLGTQVCNAATATFPIMTVGKFREVRREATIHRADGTDIGHNGAFTAVADTDSAHLKAGESLPNLENLNKGDSVSYTLKMFLQDNLVASNSGEVTATCE